MTKLFFIALAIILILINGFFVAAEFGLVKLRQTRIQAIKKIYGLPGNLLEKIHLDLDAYLSACQLGITLASLGLGWIGEPAFARLIEPLLAVFGIFSPQTITAIAFFLAFFLISFLHIVIGEIAPKSVAIRQPQTISLLTAIPLYLFYWFMYPFIWLLNKSANLVLKIFGSDSLHHNESGYSSEELKLILGTTQLQGEIEKEEAEILDNVLDFADLKVADIMRPIQEIVALSLKAPLEENLKVITQHRYSRYPVYEENPHHIVGVMHVKDIFTFMQSKKPMNSLHELIRPLLSINTEMSALELFRQFRAGITHFAIVNNLNGVTVGFVTLDNILNALLGQIRDEFIKPKSDWSLTREGALLMKGGTPLYVLEKALNIEIGESEANTIGGLLLLKLERMPKPHEKILFKDFEVETLKIKGPRILLVKIYPKKAL